MDRVAYQKIIQRILSEYAALKPSYGEIEVETIFDETQDHYEVVYSGWDGWQRVHGAFLHVDIRDGKVWIQHDGTEDGIAEELVHSGIPREHIVLAWQHPDKRKYTPFAVA